jgi:probable HAF family extracellular repeat protein
LGFTARIFSPGLITRVKKEKVMKSAKLMCITAIALLVALAIPISLAAQEHPTKHHKYKLIDLGTFGGPASILLGEYAINSRGMAVGAAETSVSDPPNSNGFPCGPGTFVYHVLEWRKDAVRDLGALPPVDQNCSNSESINDRGDSAGVSETDHIDPAIGVTALRAVLWKNGHIQDLGTLGGDESVAVVINNKGQASGFALNAIPDPFSLFDFGLFGSSSGTQTRAFLYQNGAMQDLGTLGTGNDAAGVALNERGQIAGFGYTSSTPSATTGVPPIDPFLWDNRGMLDLGSLGGTSGGVTALNNRGQVVGTSNLPGDLTFHPFLSNNGKKMQDLGTFGGDTGEADSVNDAGEVVGVADFPGNQLHDAFLWKKGKMKDLGNLGKTSHAYKINSRGQIVGGSRINDAGEIHAFLWENGGPMVDLNTLIPPGSPLQLTFGFSMNDRGEIAGTGVPLGCNNVDDCGHAYVLIPCDESNADTEGCKDDSLGTIAGSQNPPMSSTRDPAALTGDNPGPNRKMAPFLGPPIRRYRTSGGGGA